MLLVVYFILVLNYSLQVNEYILALCICLYLLFKRIHFNVLYQSDNERININIWMGLLIINLHCVVNYTEIQIL